MNWIKLSKSLNFLVSLSVSLAASLAMLTVFFVNGQNVFAQSFSENSTYIQKLLPVYGGDQEKTVRHLGYLWDYYNRLKNKENFNIDEVIKSLLETRLPSDPNFIKELEGIGVVVVFDVSGSMNESPSQGGPKKIESGILAVNEMLKTIQNLAAKSKKPIKLAAIQFSDRVKDKKLVELQSVGPSLPLDITQNVEAGGGTALGQAIVGAKLLLNQAKVKRGHIVVVTDGLNETGMHPINPLLAFSLVTRLVDYPQVHFVAFDIGGAQFLDLRQYLSGLYEATSGSELEKVLQHIASEKLILEQDDRIK